MLTANRSSDGGEPAGEGCTLTEGTFDGDFAAVGFDNALGNRQPQATALGFVFTARDTIEAMEKPFQMFGSDTVTGIVDREA